MMWNKVQHLLAWIFCGGAGLAMGVMLIWSLWFEPAVADSDARFSVPVPATPAGQTSAPSSWSMQGMASVWQKRIAPPAPKPVVKPTAHQPIKAHNAPPPVRMKLLGVALREHKPEAILRVGDKILVMREGDVAQGAELIEIAHTYVKVKQAGRDIQLPLELPR